MKRWNDPVYRVLFGVLALWLTVAGMVVTHAQSTKKPGADVAAMQPSEQWFTRLCAPATTSADVGVERAAAGILAVTDCGGQTASTTLRAMQAAFYSSGASSVLSIASNVIAPTNAVHHLGAGLVKTITVPAFCAATCTLNLVPDAAFTTDATGNISLASTAVVNKTLIMVYDGSKWNPSY
jgi:hypothetical protein